MYPPISANAPSAIELTSELVAAYVANNPVPSAELPGLIARVHVMIAGLASGMHTVEDGAPARDAVETPNSAQIRESIQHEGLVSFIDGKTYKTLKRHLTANGCNPHSYRARYGLPADYPMVAVSYAEHRSALAKAIHLGRSGPLTERERKDRRVA
ncbi:MULTISPECIES: MucR family transcriptional regulator [unclassified Methylobacterium]|uniref:MucR family transcriptional regulator n=1 Tax=unclassified Methylobacterium TaxID=2615210 RepID=UPI001FEE34FA|nr:MULTISPECIES: MucR family transcriptional regulator [unclassified Methylobacterium]